MKNIGKKIKELRQAKNLSLMKLAKQIKVSDVAISSWENAKNEPKALSLIALADFFQISADELLGRENFVTGNIEIVGERLDEKERELLNIYKNLSDTEKEAFLSMAKAVAGASKKTKE